MSGAISRFLISGLAYFLGLVFLAAGVSKLFTFQEFVSAVKAYGIFPRNLIPVLAFVLIVIEISVGALLFINRTRGLAAGVASVLLTFFLALAVYSMVWGIEGECGCFSFLRSPKGSVMHTSQDVILLMFSLIVYWDRLGRE